MNHGPNELGSQVVQACLSMGFALAGIAPAAPTSRREAYLAWLAGGKHGEMGYLTEMLDERLDVRLLLPGAKSVIMIADQYAARGAGSQDETPPPPSAAPTGLIAKYARGRDYHAVIKRRLHALCDRLRELHPGHPPNKFRTFADTGPAMEREHAERAGLGFIGKHTLLIHPRLGSYLLLGGVATTLELLTEAPIAEESPPAAMHTDHCGTCTLCIDACPTGAIEPYRLNATKCISYLTLEHRAPIDSALHSAIGDRLLGCDVCQDVCPFNRPHEGHTIAADRVNPAYIADGPGAGLPILEVLNWTENDRTRALGPSAGKRSSLAMLRRNAIIVAGNALNKKENPELRDRLRRIAADNSEDATIRDTAQQALD